MLINKGNISQCFSVPMTPCLRIKKYFKANVTYNVIARAKVHMLNKIDYYTLIARNKN